MTPERYRCAVASLVVLSMGMLVLPSLWCAELWAVGIAELTALAIIGDACEVEL